MADDLESIWKPLDASRQETRLLILFPSTDYTEFPTGHLTTISLAHIELVRPFFAISHAWGQAQQTMPLYVDGKRLLITHTLYQCLRSFRDKKREVAFWLDAVCVDQRNLEERAQQVRLMRHVFSQAKEVRVWLGTGLPILKELINDVGAFWQLPKYPKHADIEKHVNQIMLFNRLDWWSRLWVKQEIALARSVRLFYGDSSTTIGDLWGWTECVPMRIRNHIPKSEYLTEIADCINKNRRLADLRLLLSNSETLSKERRWRLLLEMLATSRTASVSDVRDRVYGQLGIIEWVLQQELLQPDYSMTASDVFIGFGYRLCYTTRSLDMLNQASPPRNAIVSLPTWVPDWSSRDSLVFETWHLTTLHEHYAATLGFTMPEPRIGMRSQLQLGGHCFDGLAKVGEVCENYDELHTTFSRSYFNDVLRKWKRQYEREAKNIPHVGEHSNGQEVLHKFARTVYRDVHGYEKPFALRRILQDSDAMESLTQIQNTTTEVSRNSVLLSYTMGNSRFFITSSGRPGLGPPELRTGDVVALLLGGRVPYILRRSRQSPEPDVYTFVGECYVHGVMDGEAFDESKVHDIWLE